MQPLKISKPLSKNSRPKRKLLWAGIAIVLFLSATLTAPFVIRSDRKLIGDKLTSIAHLQETQQETAYKDLLAATGGDQEVSRRLAEFYSKRHQHALAAQIYEHAREALLIEASSEYVSALDYTQASNVSRRATQHKPTAESLAWQGLVFFNQGNKEKGCEKSREAIDKDKTSAIAKQSVEACMLVTKNESDPWTLTAANLNQLALQKIEGDNTASGGEYLLLAHMYEEAGKSDKALGGLKKAIEIMPYDRAALQATVALCDLHASLELCSTIKVTAQHTLDLLPAQ